MVPALSHFVRMRQADSFQFVDQAARQAPRIALGVLDLAGRDEAPALKRFAELSKMLVKPLLDVTA